MKVSTNFRCRCGNKQKISFKKPGAFDPVSLNVDCDLCESRFFLTFKKRRVAAPADNQRRTQLEMECKTQVLKVSSVLQELMREEAETKAEEAKVE